MGDYRGSYQGGNRGGGGGYRDRYDDRRGGGGGRRDDHRGGGGGGGGGGAGHLARIHGTEEDRVNCPFYFKIGACRHGDRCSRAHNRPLFSQTLLIAQMFSNPEARAAGNPSAPRPDARESEEEYEDFYIELFQELAKYGEVEDLVVCDNLGDHLVGNVYAKFYDEEDVASAIQGLFGRFYNKHKLQVEYSPVTDFRESRCRQYDEGRCARGGFCNFMHIKKVPREIKRELMKTQPQHGVRSGGGGGGGRGDEQGGNDYHRRGASSGRGSGRRRSPSPYGGGRPSSSSGGSRRDRDRGSSSRRDRDDRGDRGREGGSGGLAPEAAANGDSSGAPPSRRRGGRSSDRERRRQRRRERDSVGESGGGDGVSAGAAYAKEDEKMVGQAQPVGMEGQALPAVAPPTADGAVPVPPPTSAY